MAQIEITRRIEQPPSKIWSILKDFGGIHKFNSGVERSPITNGIESGLGSERRCDLYDGSSIEEVVSGYREGEWMEVTITKADIPLNDVIAEFHVSQTSDGHAQVVLRFDYTPKFGPLGQLMNALVIRKKFTQVLEGMLDGLALHAATGVIIGKDGVQAAEESVRAVA